MPALSKNNAPSRIAAKRVFVQPKIGAFCTPTKPPQPPPPISPQPIIHPTHDAVPPEIAAADDDAAASDDDANALPEPRRSSKKRPPPNVPRIAVTIKMQSDLITLRLLKVSPAEARAALVAAYMKSAKVTSHVAEKIFPKPATLAGHQRRLYNDETLQSEVKRQNSQGQGNIARLPRRFGSGTPWNPVAKNSTNVTASSTLR
jgi:hypothetical protein